MTILRASAAKNFTNKLAQDEIQMESMEKSVSCDSEDERERNKTFYKLVFRL